jgi:hypothetical protein
MEYVNTSEIDHQNNLHSDNDARGLLIFFMFSFDKSYQTNY